ncbi:MAG: hypothetical protein ACR2PR_07175, partial [Pseudohongiellaceae bacterium]
YASKPAVDLLLGTAAQESLLGTYVRQVGGGPALGIYQMEPATHDDILDNYVRYHDDLVDKLAEIFGSTLPMAPERLVYDLRYATIMARLHYYRRPEPLPDDLVGLAQYWKTHYNTELGAGTVSEYVHNARTLLA